MIDRVQKRKDLPYITKAKWYKFFLEVNDGSYVITTQDREATTTSSILKVPGMNIIDYVFEGHNVAESLVTTNKSFKYYADGSQGVVLPASNSVDYIAVWVLGTNFEE